MYCRLLNSTILLFLLILSLQYNSLAEDSNNDQNQKNNELSVEQEAINRDRELLKKLMLQNQPPRQPDPVVKGIEFDIGENEIKGSHSSRLIMVQFSDYTCGHCALYTKEIFPEIVKNYVKPGKLRYVVVDYPLPGDSPAIRAAEAAHCASDQGKFWEMHEEIMEEQQHIQDINYFANSINLEMDKFKECMESGKYAGMVNENIALASNFEIPSVPNFIIGEIDPGNPKKVKGISYIRGAKPYTQFKQEIDRALEEIP